MAWLVVHVFIKACQGLVRFDSSAPVFIHYFPVSGLSTCVFIPAHFSMRPNRPPLGYFRSVLDLPPVKCGTWCTQDLVMDGSTNAIGGLERLFSFPFRVTGLSGFQ